MRRTIAECQLYLVACLACLPLIFWTQFQGRDILTILIFLDINISDFPQASKHPIYYPSMQVDEPRPLGFLAYMLHRGFINRGMFTKAFLKKLQNRGYLERYMRVWGVQDHEFPKTNARSTEQLIDWAKIIRKKYFCPSDAELSTLSEAQKRFRHSVLGITVTGVEDNKMVWEFPVDIDKSRKALEEEFTSLASQEYPAADRKAIEDSIAEALDSVRTEADRKNYPGKKGAEQATEKKGQASTRPQNSKGRRRWSKILDKKTDDESGESVDQEPDEDLDEDCSRIDGLNIIDPNDNSDDSGSSDDSDEGSTAAQKPASSATLKRKSADDKNLRPKQPLKKQKAQTKAREEGEDKEEELEQLRDDNASLRRQLKAALSLIATLNGS